MKPLDASRHQTYTEEQPNSLTPDEVPLFLDKAWEMYPQHYAMLALGIVTGRRPSELRPLRRKGPEPDVLWDRGEILIRRSETRGEPLEGGKTNNRLRIPLPDDLMAILRWHANRLEGPQRESDLLFPARPTKDDDGNLVSGFFSESTLQKPVRLIAEAIGMRKHLSPRFMRRTFNDLRRRVEIEAIVARSISGHVTQNMQDHYSTVSRDEQKEGLAKIVSIMRLRKVAV